MSMDVSTGLSLHYNPWTFTKKLQESDINGQSRLMLHTESVQTHILPMLGPILTAKIETNAGVRVTIWDADTDSDHELTLKKWPSTGSYVLINNWKMEFVNRRELRQGEEIGLLWDPYKSKFYFRVLSRSLGN